jgi:hypothetical protein
MTAEIAILNRRGVALAADSAVTIAYPGGRKIYFTANKLFMLSQYHPIGVMFYGAAEFMEVPWETIVKAYRTAIQAKPFDTLEEYAQDFLAFLESGDNGWSSEEQQRQFFARLIYWINFVVREKLGTSGRVESGADFEDSITATVAGIHEEWAKADRLASLPDGYDQNILQHYGSFIESFIDNSFKNLPLSNKARKLLLEICVYAATKSIFPQNNPGVVIAGFGEKEIFPSLVCYNLDAIILDRLTDADIGN